MANTKTSAENQKMKHQVKVRKPEVVEETFDLVIERPEGAKKLIVPPECSWADARRAIKEMEEAEESLMSFHHTIDCYPLDGMLAVDRAMLDIYGFTAQSTPGFFGPNPPHRVAVKTGHTDADVEYALYGDFAPPAWEGGTIGVAVDSNQPGSLTIRGRFKKKFEKEAKAVLEAAKRMLRENSIYRGKAVELDMEYIITGQFNPDTCAPAFMDVTREIELILPRDIQFQLEENLWNTIAYPEDLKFNKIPTKSGVLLSGRFGTGKSLTSYRTSQVCVENGFSFFYLKTPQTFLAAYKLAQLYSPCVLFVEDIDAVFGGERNPVMNSILETLDGVTAKKSSVITVFTTNHPEKIHEAFLRPGRVDTHIKFTPPDAEAAGRFVLQQGGALLTQDAKDRIGEIGQAFANLVPAVITEGLIKAKKVAIGRYRREHGKDGEPLDLTGKLDAESLLVAGEVMQKQVAESQGPTESPEAMELALIRHTFPGLFNKGDGGLDSLMKMMDSMRGRRR